MTDQTQSEQAASPVAAELSREPRRRGSWLAVLALLVALCAAAASGWQWYESHRAAALLEQQLARKLSEIDAANRDGRALAAATRDIARDVEARVGQLETRLVEMQNQRLALETLYQELSHSRDELVLAEIEQILLIASQQLQLAGNVKAALIALEAADTRLARSDRPQLTAVRRVIQRDIEQLTAAPFVDVTGMGLKLERVIESIDRLPLAMETRPVDTGANAQSVTPQTGWRAVAAEVWRDLRSLVRIENMSAPDIPLLAPEQVFFLRENLKLRLLGARLALLARDDKSYKTDINASIQWLQRYYDPNAPAVGSALTTLQQLARSDLYIELPDVGASLDTVRNARLVRERTRR